LASNKRVVRKRLRLSSPVWDLVGRLLALEVHPNLHELIREAILFYASKKFFPTYQDWLLELRREHYQE